MVSYAPEIADEPVVPTPGGNRQFTVTAVSADTAKGTVTGGGTFSEGSRITLTATPKGGYAFDRWSDGVTTATRTVVVSETKTLTATFKVATETGGEDEENYM